MKAFLWSCQHMRLPRPEDLFLHDVEIFMQENKIKSRSKSGRPGKYWHTYWVHLWNHIPPIKIMSPIGNTIFHNTFQMFHSTNYPFLCYSLLWHYMHFILGYFWLKGFKESDPTNIVFPTKGQVAEIMNRSLSLDDWSKEKRSYILRENQGMLPKTRSQILMAEVEQIRINKNCMFHFMVRKPST